MAKIMIDLDDVKALIEGYMNRHPLASEFGGEYIMQDDTAQEDALQLVCDIFNNMEHE